MADENYPIFGAMNPVPPTAAQDAAKQYAASQPRSNLTPVTPIGQATQGVPRPTLQGWDPAATAAAAANAGTLPPAPPAFGPYSGFSGFGEGGHPLANLFNAAMNFSRPAATAPVSNGLPPDMNVGPPDRQAAQEQMERAAWNAHVDAIKKSPQGYALSGAGIPDALLAAPTPGDWTKQGGLTAMAGKGLRAGQYRELNVAQTDGSRIFGSAVNGGASGDPGKGGPGKGGLNNFVGVGGAGPGGAGAGGKGNPLSSAMAQLDALNSMPMNTSERKQMRLGLMSHIIGLMGAQHNQGMLDLETQKAIPGIQMANQVAGQLGSNPERAAQLAAAQHGQGASHYIQTPTGAFIAPAFGGVPGTSYGLAGTPPITVTPPAKIKLSRDDERR